MFAVLAALGCSSSGRDGSADGSHGAGDSAETTGETGETGEAPKGLVFDGEPPKNLLIITVDTLRRDYAGFFDQRGLTPNLTSIFSQGVVLENHRSCSNWTAPSFMCAQTGRFPLDDGYWPSGLAPANSDTRVDWPPPDLTSIAGLLTDAGYTTELITTNSCFSLALNGGAYGFQTETRAFDKDATTAVDLALASAKRLESTTDPWYLHVHFMDPHGPYGAPAKYLPDPTLDCSDWDLSTQTGITEFIWSEYPNSDPAEQAEMMACFVNDYSAEVRYFDDELGRLWSDLEEKGLLDHTLVVFYSDHGEQFNEHGRFQHTWSLYQEENAAVAAFWSHDIRSTVWTGPTIHQDLAPTILDALGVPLGDHTGIVLGDAPDDRALVMFNAMNDWGGTVIASIQNDHKLLYWWTGGRGYFDLSVDPNEQTDIYDATDPELLALWEVMGAEIDKAQTFWPDLVPVAPGP